MLSQSQNVQRYIYKGEARSWKCCKNAICHLDFFFFIFQNRSVRTRACVREFCVPLKFASSTRSPRIRRGFIWWRFRKSFVATYIQQPVRIYRNIEIYSVYRLYVLYERFVDATKKYIPFFIEVKCNSSSIIEYGSCVNACRAHIFISVYCFCWIIKYEKSESSPWQIHYSSFFGGVAHIDWPMIIDYSVK